MGWNRETEGVGLGALTRYVVSHILNEVATVVYGDFEWDDAKAKTRPGKAE